MPITTRLYWNKSASVMYIRIPPFQEGKRKFVPPKKEGPTAYSVFGSALQTEYTLSAGALSTQTP